MAKNNKVDNAWKIFVFIGVALKDREVLGVTILIYWVDNIKRLLVSFLAIIWILLACQNSLAGCTCLEMHASAITKETGAHHAMP